MTATAEDLANVKAAKTVDSRGCACPGPLLEAKKSIGSIKVGEVLEIWSGSQDTRTNLSRWCKKTGNEFMGYIDEGAYDRLFIRRQK